MARTATAAREHTDDMAGQETTTMETAKPAHPIVQFKSYLDQRMNQIELALPPHMTPERFGRVVLTALQRTPTLLACTKESLFNACMLAAQDGLLPDGREGAIVPYADGKKDQAQWMPMIEGLRKKARNSGEISNWEVAVAYERDEFEVVRGDSPRIIHKPYFGPDDPGAIIGAYSIAWLKDGTISREAMTIREINKIKAVSKAQKGPWSNPTFFPEMCKKTVARRHYKILPHAAEMDTFIQRLDEREGLSDEALQIEGRQQQRIGSTSAAFDAFASAGQPAPETIEHDPQTGEVRDGAGGQQQAQQTGEQQKPKEEAKPADAPKEGAQQPTAAEQQPDISKGDEAHRGDGGDGLDDDLPLNEGKAEEGAWPTDRLPTNAEDFEHKYVPAVLASFTTGGDVKAWFTSAEQKALRPKIGVLQEAFDRVKTVASKRIAELSKKG